MNKRFAITGIIAFAFLLLNVSPSLADTISVTQPGATDGFGSTYMLSANCTGSVCNVTLTIDSTKATNPDISAVDFKIGSSDTLSGTVVPPNGTRLAARWETVAVEITREASFAPRQPQLLVSRLLVEF